LIQPFLDIYNSQILLFQQRLREIDITVRHNLDLQKTIEENVSRLKDEYLRDVSVY